MRFASILVAGLLGTLFVLTAKAETPPLKVMSYNLRYASPLGKNSWPTRRPILAELVKSHSPDVIGTQEGLYHQLKDIEKDLEEYEWIGLGREGGSRGEFMAIFYKRDRFEPIEYDHYWLSDTPNVIGSASWGNNVRRMVTWVRFKDLAAGREFYFINTHFDHQSQPSREKSAELLLERANALQKDMPTILVGDFNAAAESNKAYDTLVGKDGFQDTWKVAKHLGAQTQSFNGFFYPAKEQGARIDWILFRGPIEAKTVVIDPFAKDKQYPSDHFPVIAEFEYPDK